MPDLTAKRTLVKSAPELWGELSEAERLAKHLGAFGEIEITELEPEHTVAWEGEHASGTVSIEPSGWGTKVTLTAELAELENPPVPPEVEEPAVEEPRVEEPAVEELPAVEEPVVEGPLPREGLWSRLFRRRPKGEAGPDADEAAETLSVVGTAETEATAPKPEPEPEPEFVTAIPTDEARAVLDDTLEALGAAHHRPFSRG